MSQTLDFTFQFRNLFVLGRNLFLGGFVDLLLLGFSLAEDLHVVGGGLILGFFDLGHLVAQADVVVGSADHLEGLCLLKRCDEARLR